MDIKQEHLDTMMIKLDNFYVRALEATTDDNLDVEELIRWTMRNWRYECSSYEKIR